MTAGAGPGGPREYRQIRYEVAERTATITLDRPDKLNAYTEAMRLELDDAFDRADADDEVRAVIVTGAGERAFCAGADLTPGAGTNPFSGGGEVADLSDERVRDSAGLLTLRIFRSTKPVIGVSNGAAIGIGATMQLPMDIRIASTTARFGFVFTRRGIVPEGASAWFLPRIVGLPRALEWTITGRVFGAEEALAGGLVRSLHPPGELMAAARALAAEIAENTSPVAVALTRAMLWRLSSLDHPVAAHRVDSRLLYKLARSPDMAEGVASFLDKRSPAWPGKVSSDMPTPYPWWDEPGYE